MAGPDKYLLSRPNAVVNHSSSLLPMTSDGLHQPLLNLTKLRSRMDNVHRFLSDSLNTNTIIREDHMDIVSKEIRSAINQVIVNGAALLSYSEIPNFSSAPASLTFEPKNPSQSDPDLPSSQDVDLGFPKVEVLDEEVRNDWDIVELDAVELLAEHLHFCEFCGKGFKRDANLRMHMRAHGNKFKTLEALAKPEKAALSSEVSRGGGRTRFSCPFTGCSRNKMHKKFKPLKSVICVKNHFKRSHCPKMYSCNLCHKKNFSVLADLKSHLKHCGETKWKCSCGTSFSRKDKLFGHMALFEGHMPAVAAEVPAEDDDKVIEETAAVMAEDEDDGGSSKPVKGMNPSNDNLDNGFFDTLLDEFGSIDDFCIDDVLGGSSNGSVNWNL